MELNLKDYFKPIQKKALKLNYYLQLKNFRIYLYIVKYIYFINNEKNMLQIKFIHFFWKTKDDEFKVNLIFNFHFWSVNLKDCIKKVKLLRKIKLSKN